MKFYMTQRIALTVELDVTFITDLTKEQRNTYWKQRERCNNLLKRYANEILAPIRALPVHYPAMRSGYLTVRTIKGTAKFYIPQHDTLPNVKRHAEIRLRHYLESDKAKEQRKSAKTKAANKAARFAPK